jgi:hypothetical protein
VMRSLRGAVMSSARRSGELALLALMVSADPYSDQESELRALTMLPPLGAHAAR